jgi:ectoine hydroxylase
MHGSGNNITPFPRSNAFFVYNSIENRVVAPFAAKQPRPDFLATRRNIRPIRDMAAETAAPATTNPTVRAAE